MTDKPNNLACVSGEREGELPLTLEQTASALVAGLAATALTAADRPAQTRSDIVRLFATAASWIGGFAAVIWLYDEMKRPLVRREASACNR